MSAAQAGRLGTLWQIARAIEYRGLPGDLAHLQLTALTRRCASPTKRNHLGIVGATSRTQVEDVLYPSSYAPRTRLNRGGRQTERRGSGAGRSSIFRGRRWDNVLIVPFFDLEHHVRGFAFRDGDGKTGEAFAFYPSATRRNGTFEAGLAMLPLLREPKHHVFKDSVFIFLDVDAALKMQLKHLQSSLIPLPIVIARDEGCSATTAELWQQVQQQDRVLVHGTVTEAVIRQAQRAKARIAIDPKAMAKIMGPPRFDDYSMLRISAFDLLQQQMPIYSYLPNGLLTRLRKRALNWQTVLQEHLLSLSPKDAQSFLDRAVPDEWERHRFLADCCEYLRSRLSTVAGPALLHRRVKIGHQIVVERDGAWWIEASNNRICDQVHTDRLLRCRHGDDQLAGHVVVDDQRHDFLLSLPRVEAAGLLPSLQRHLSSRGVLFKYRQRWSEPSLNMALRFSSPEEFPNADAIGWCGANYRFPNFGISAAGISAERAAPIVEPKAPCLTLRLPEPINQHRLRTVTLKQPAVLQFWAVLRGLLTMVASPVLRRRPLGVLLVGEQADQVLNSIARGLGCVTNKYSSRVDISTYHSAAKRHSWPTTLQLPSSVKCVDRALAVLRPDNIVAAVRTVDIDQALSRGWWIIAVQSAQDVSALIESYGADVLLSFLPELLARQRELRSDLTQVNTALWNCFLDWWDARCRGRSVITLADQLVQCCE